MKLIGLARLGRDVEVRYMQDQNQTPVANLLLAYNYGQKDGEGNRQTQWVEGALWGPRAESLAPYLLKGQQLDVFLDDVHVELYDRADGSVGSKIVGRVMSLDFGARPQGGDGGQQQQQRSNGQQQQQRGQQRQQPAGQRSQSTQQQYSQQSRGGGRPANPQSSAGGGGAPRGGGFDEMDDSIPF